MKHSSVAMDAWITPLREAALIIREATRYER
jgi:hypothetical protein